MKRFFAIIMTLVMLLSLSVSVFAEEAQEAQYTLYMDRNGKTLLDADGNAVSGGIKNAAVAEFYRLLNGTPVNWTDFEHIEFEVFADEDGNVTFGKQTLFLPDGALRTSSDAEVGMYMGPSCYHASGEGEVTFTMIDPDGAEIGSGIEAVEMNEFGSFVFKCLCRNCDENQDDHLHMMICGHYYCEAGDVGHGAGACGIPGHMNCDGDCHDPCPNCRQPLCSGEHGWGVCEHVHQWLSTPSCSICNTCHMIVNDNGVIFEGHDPNL